MQTRKLLVGYCGLVSRHRPHYGHSLFRCGARLRVCVPRDKRKKAMVMMSTSINGDYKTIVNDDLVCVAKYTTIAVGRKAPVVGLHLGVTGF